MLRVLKGRYALIAIVLLVTFVGGWVAALTFQSPEQREAAAQPPAQRPIVAPVTTGRLADQITTRADITRTSRHALRAIALPPNATVTSVVARRGQSVDAGDALITVNGRPLFVLPGSFDFYRDLAPGDEGLDVTQLQTALERAGQPVSDLESGTFGPGTEQAVSAMYSEAGFEPAVRERPRPPQPTVGPRATPPPPPPPPPPMVVMPVAEVTVSATLPAVVSTLPSVGDQLTPGQAFANLETGALVARATVAPQAAVRLERGMPVELTTDDGRAAAGTITAVSTGATGPEAAEPFILVTPEKPLPPEWRGRNVLARITLEVRSKPTLIVPTIAVTATTDGEAVVFKEVAEGDFVRVPVRELATLAGRSAVEPVESGALSEGDKVRVG